MNCKKCGFQLTENDQFCKNCGTPVDNISVQNNGGFVNQNTQSFSQPNMMNQSTPQQENVYKQPINNYAQSTMQQPSWTNTYNSQPINQPQKNNNTKAIIIGFIVAVVIASVFAIFIVFSVNKSNSGSGNENNNSSKSTYSVNFKNFKFSVPDDLVYEVSADSLILGDETGTWVAYIQIGDGNFSKIKANRSKLQSNIKTKGYTATAADLKKAGGVEFVTIEVSAENENLLVGYAHADSTHFASITVMNQSGSVDYKVLETIAPVISSFKYSPSSNNISINEKIDINVIEELAK